MGHHEMNGSLTSPGVYPGLISPQMSAAAAAAYGRSPIVSIPASVQNFYESHKLSSFTLIIFMYIYHLRQLDTISPHQHQYELSSEAVCS